MTRKTSDTSLRHQARQGRSQETEDKILASARELFAAKTFDKVSVAEIARHAGVSVGGLYARFKDKAALALAVDERLLDDAQRIFEREMGEESLAGSSAGQVVQTYLRTMLRYIDKHKVLLGNLALKVRGDDRYQGLSRVREFNDYVHGVLCARLLERRDEIHHPDPERGAAFGIMMVSAAAREMALFGEKKMNLASSEGRELVRELTRAFCGYLGAPLPEDL